MAMSVDMVVWLALAIILGIAEIFTVGFFVIFFALGALVAAATCFLTDSTIIQTVVFVVASVLMVWLGRPVLKKNFKVGDKPAHESNVGALIGAEALVLEEVDQYRGKVKVVHTGETWTAYLSPDYTQEILPVGSPALIEKVDGAKLAVRPKV